MTSAHPNGPPPEETLDEQLEVLKAAQHIQPRLKEVAFLDDVKWIADDNGFWVAVYEGRMGRTLYLTPKPDTQVPEGSGPQESATSSLRESLQLILSVWQALTSLFQRRQANPTIGSVASQRNS